MATSSDDRAQLIVTVRGEVNGAAKDYAGEKLGRAIDHAHGPVLLARVKLTSTDDHAGGDRTELAEATFDVNGRLVRAQVAAHRMDEAIDLLADRMIRQLDRTADKDRTVRRRSNGNDAPPTVVERPPVMARPSDEREVVAHKSFAIDRSTLEEAAFDMEVLDYDFFLFTDADSGQDRVVYRQDGEVRTATDPPTESLAEALERLDAGGEPFVFFCDRETGRGAVAYLRYDGHYGLIRPADG